ncbi:hypothetical protein FGO68_gene9890 [Halteria grandinella]|uniref:3-oxo-5-alpha-steroid 4-dehydrogenase C-terminal domain-containing protein n=1 Tax=Halteria grandinella TaxID=5974 RepID=A0A8J8SZY8_HALGN|nr:hypothetical protein FGO68_gene9890 [Halteria grandinella]
MSIRLKIVGRSNKELGSVTISASSTVESLKKILLKDIDRIKKRNIGIERIGLQVQDSADPKKIIVLSERRKILSDYISGSQATLSFKDIGPQIPLTTVLLVEYFGPLLITFILVAFQKLIYGKVAPYTFNQKVGIAMVIGHYLNRGLETLFVHRFSKDTIPFMNLFKNFGNDWVIFGFVNMYFFLHPDYKASAWASETLQIVFACIFAFFEFLNLMCNITLRNLSSLGRNDKGIPKGWGFDYVSCANYYWESLCWLVFAIQAQSSVRTYFSWQELFR